jgi:glycosyltransferase involved in cell wall biosynthesis
MDFLAMSSSIPSFSASSVSPALLTQEKVARPQTSEENLHRIRIALITSFPPSRGDLNEYGYHLARALQNDPRVQLIILADDSSSQPELPGFHVERCWRFDSAFNLMRLSRSIRKADPDVVWFNIGFSTFARSPIAAFLGITIPAMTRLLGFYTHITLHTVFQRINLKDAGVRWPSLYRMAGQLATRLLLAADDVTVLLPSFRTELINHYRVNSQRVHFHAHGTFGNATFTDSSLRDHAECTILAFGYWGTYKRLELLLEAMAEVTEQFPNALLLIAGTDHPSTLGYLQSLKQEVSSKAKAHFLGYVPEAELQALFTRSTLLVLPYSSAAGASGVVHQGCEYGLPILAADIPEIRESALEEGIAIDFYPPGDGRELTKQLIRLLASPNLRRDIAEHNLSIAKNMQLSHVINEYLDLFQTRIQQSRRQAYGY